ncbi:MAG: hypothetical protein FWF81_11055 [Defluviitaleaceae bacterium]|nr:hypothetical protein [Defluviitaleaceae bacterium]
MYRIMCNSLKNYASDFNHDINNPRYKHVYFLRLIENPAEFYKNKKENTHNYQMLAHFLWTLRDCERSSRILHELSLLEIKGSPQWTDIDESAFDETNRIWHLLLKKAYWRD